MPATCLHRCHHCANEDCPEGTHGQRRIVEGGCPVYERLDPMLRPHRYAGKRRIKKVTTVKLDPENIDFVIKHVLPMDPKMLQGALNRGVELCVKYWLDKAGDEIPIISKADRSGKFVREDRKLAFSPEVLKRMDAVVDHWRGTAHSTTRSQLINHFIKQTREGVDQQRASA